MRTFESECSFTLLNESWYRYVFFSHLLVPSDMVINTLLERNWILIAWISFGRVFHKTNVYKKKDLLYRLDLEWLRMICIGFLNLRLEKRKSVSSSSVYQSKTNLCSRQREAIIWHSSFICRIRSRRQSSTDLPQAQIIHCLRYWALPWLPSS